MELGQCPLSGAVSTLLSWLSVALDICPSADLCFSTAHPSPSPFSSQTGADPLCLWSVGVKSIKIGWWLSLDPWECPLLPWDSAGTHRHSMGRASNRAHAPFSVLGIPSDSGNLYGISYCHSPDLQWIAQPWQWRCPQPWKWSHPCGSGP